MSADSDVALSISALGNAPRVLDAAGRSGGYEMTSPQSGRAAVLKFRNLRGFEIESPLYNFTSAR
jgi:hypothetical protein